jgi:drug/metabolite transporter (DMT)-like permease
LTQSNQGKLYLTGAFTLAGTSVMTGYLLSAKLGGFTIIALSMVIVLAGLSPFYAAKTIQTTKTLSRRDWTLLLLQAAFGIFLFRLFLLLGVRSTSTAEAGILTGTTPAITALLAFFVLKEKISGFTAIGIGATVAGMLLLQGNSLFSVRFSSKHFFGNTLVLCAAASESTFNIISRRHQTHGKGASNTPLHPMVQTLLVCAFTLGLCAVPALLERPFPALFALEAQEWLALVWYGIVVTALAFALFYAGAKRCDAYTIAAFSGAMPMTSVLLSLFFLHERITWIQWCGGAFLLLGMVWIGQKNRRTKC